MTANPQPPHRIVGATSEGHRIVFVWDDANGGYLDTDTGAGWFTEAEVLDMVAWVEDETLAS